MKVSFLRKIVSVVSLTVLSLGVGAQTDAPVQAPPNLPNPGTLSTPTMPQARSSSSSTNQVLTLADAESRALKNQPRLLAQQFREEAAHERITESRSGYFPQMFGNLTAVDANGDTAVAAGTLTTSSVSKRAAGGGSLVQLITDFGHTSNLVQSARFDAQAARQGPK
jgi:outer membrane protein